MAGPSLGPGSAWTGFVAANSVDEVKVPHREVGANRQSLPDAGKIERSAEAFQEYHFLTVCPFDEVIRQTGAGNPPTNRIAGGGLTAGAKPAAINL